MHPFSQYIKRKGFTYAKLAKKSGLPKRTLEAWGAGNGKPGPKELVAIARAIGDSIQGVVEGFGVSCAGLPRSKPSQEDQERMLEMAAQRVREFDETIASMKRYTAEMIESGAVQGLEIVRTGEGEDDFKIVKKK